MSVSNTTVRELYNGTGSLDTFAIPSEYEGTESLIKVYIRDTTADPVTETLKVSGTDYNISGGNVVFVTPPLSTDKVLVTRESPRTQTHSLSSNSAYPSANEENALDRIVLQIQELQEQVDRCIKFQKSSSLSLIDLLDVTASQYLRVHQTGNYIEGVTSLGTLTLGDGDVTTPKLADDSVTADKLAHDLIFPSTGRIRFPVGTTAQRLAASGGDARYNSTLSRVELYDGSYIRIRDRVITKNSAYTATEEDDVILCDASSAAFTVTLYAASTANEGKKIRIKKTDSDISKAVTIDGNGAETIDGATTIKLVTQNDTVVLVCDGTNWKIESRTFPTNWIDYSPTISASFGTTSNENFEWMQTGVSSMRIRFRFTAGTGSGTAGQITIPTGTIQTDGSAVAGFAWGANLATDKDCFIAAVDGDAYFEFFKATGSSTRLNGGDFSGADVDGQLEIEVAEWKV